MKPLAAKRAFFEGRVQGVGFRFSVKEIAHGFDVVGWVGEPSGRQGPTGSAGHPRRSRAVLRSNFSELPPAPYPASLDPNYRTNRIATRIRDPKIKEGRGRIAARLRKGYVAATSHNSRIFKNEGAP